MKLIYLILTGILAFSLVAALASAVCTPHYVCADWGECLNGLQTRKCLDTFCGQDPIVERKLCGPDKKDCQVKYTCTDWSPCTYLDKTNDIINNNINYKGYQERTCEDANACVEGFAEQRACEDVFKVNFVKVEQCGIPYLMALDTNSKREVSQINLASWQSQQLDIAFIQSNFSYCPTCYNGVQDPNEQGIDCGGDCKPCVSEKGISDQTFFVSSSWITSALIFGAFAFTTFFNRNTRMRYLIYKAYQALDKKDKNALQAAINSIKKLYRTMAPDQQASFKRDLDRLYRRI